MQSGQNTVEAQRRPPSATRPLHLHGKGNSIARRVRVLSKPKLTTPRIRPASPTPVLHGWRVHCATFDDSLQRTAQVPSSKEQGNRAPEIVPQ